MGKGEELNDNFYEILQQRRHEKLMGVLSGLVKSIDEYNQSIKLIMTVVSDPEKDKISKKSVVDLSNQVNTVVDRIEKSINVLIDDKKDEEWEFTVIQRDEYTEKIKKVVAKKIV